MGVVVCKHEDMGGSTFGTLGGDTSPPGPNIGSLNETGGNREALVVSNRRVSTARPSHARQRGTRSDEEWRRQTPVEHSQNVVTQDRANRLGKDPQALFVANLPSFVNTDGDTSCTPCSDRVARTKLRTPRTTSRRVNEVLKLQEARRGILALELEASSSSAKSISFGERQRGGHVSLPEPSSRRPDCRLHQRRHILCSSTSSAPSFVDIEPASRSMASDAQSNAGSFGNTSGGSTARSNHTFLNSLENTKTLKNAKAVLRKHVNHSLVSSLQSAGLHSSNSTTCRAGSEEDDTLLKNRIPFIGLGDVTTTLNTPSREDDGGNRQGNHVLVRAVKKILPSSKLWSRGSLAKNNISSRRDTSIPSPCPLIELVDASVTSFAAGGDEFIEEECGRQGKQQHRRFVYNRDCTPTSSNPSPCCSIQGRRGLSLKMENGNGYKPLREEENTCCTCRESTLNGDDDIGSGDTSGGKDEKEEVNGGDSRSGSNNTVWIAIGGESGIGSKDWYARLRERCKLEDSEDFSSPIGCNETPEKQKGDNPVQVSLVEAEEPSDGRKI